jgi:hypothetical protein
MTAREAREIPAFEGKTGTEEKKQENRPKKNNASASDALFSARKCANSHRWRGCRKWLFDSGRGSPITVIDVRRLRSRQKPNTARGSWIPYRLDTVRQDPRMLRQRRDSGVRMPRVRDRID